MSDEITTPNNEIQTPVEENTPSEVVTPEVVTEPEVVTPPVVESETTIITPESTPIDPIPTEPIPVSISVEPEPVIIPETKIEEPAPVTPITVHENPPVISETPKQTEISQKDKDNIIREFLASMMIKARIAVQTKKTKNLESIMSLFETHQNITNNMVEKALKVSNSSARKYLERLEKQGKIIQHGTTGRGVFYTKL